MDTDRAPLSSTQLTHTRPSIILPGSTVNHSPLLDIALHLSVPLPLPSFTVLSSLPPSAFHSHASDPSRCFHPCYTLPFIGLHLLYCSPRSLHTPLSCARSQIAVRSRASQISNVLHGSMQVNLAGRAAAAQFAHLRQSMKITQRDDNTSERLHGHTHSHTHSYMLQSC